jgi:hypothetical protein
VERVTEQDELIIRYLLAELTAAEAERFEARYFDDDSRFEQLLAVEDELFEAYARGELSGRERERFEAHLLAAPRGRERVEFARELSRSLTARPTSASRDDERGAPSWRSLLTLSFLSHPTARLAFATLLLVLLAGTAWVVFKRHTRPPAFQQTARQTERGVEPRQTPPPATPETTAQPTPTSPTTPAPTAVARAATTPTPDRRSSIARATVPRPVVASLLITGAMARGMGEVKSLIVPPGASFVRLQAEVPAPVTGEHYRVAVQTVEGVEIWSRGNLTPARGGSGRGLLSVQLPARLLPAGDYILAINLTDARGRVEEPGLSYSFRVQTR